jgi:hypothetical protein
MKLEELQAKLRGLSLAPVRDADNIAIATFHYNFFRGGPPAVLRPEDHPVYEFHKRCALLEALPYLPELKQAEIRAMYGDAV